MLSSTSTCMFCMIQAGPSSVEIGLGMLGFLIFAAVLPVIFLWKICEKAGFAGYLSLLVFLGPGFLVLLGILAYAQWPALQKAGHKQSAEEVKHSDEK